MTFEVQKRNWWKFWKEHKKNKFKEKTHLYTSFFKNKRLVLV